MEAYKPLITSNDGKKDSSGEGSNIDMHMDMGNNMGMDTDMGNNMVQDRVAHQGAV